MSSYHRGELETQFTPEKLDIKFNGKGSDFSYVGNVVMVCNKDNKDEKCLEEFRSFVEHLQTVVAEAHKNVNK